METVKFNSMYGPGVPKTGLDYSRTKEPVYTEVPPYAMNEKGEFINKSSFPMLVKTGEVDVQEKIQSYAKEVDIYSILERFSMTGDVSILNRSVGSYMDISDLPSDIHAFDEYVLHNIEALKKVDPELAQVILNEDSTEESIKNSIDKYVKGVVSKNVQKSTTEAKTEKAVTENKEVAK